MRNLVVIPARGGSKGIPKKNIVLLNNRPLLEYTLEAFLNADLEGRIVVSTDSDEIAEVAKKYAKVVIIKRPDELAADTSSTEEALLHAVKTMREQYFEEFDTVITAQPTSPLRKVETIRRFVSEFESYYGDFDAQITFTETKVDLWKRGTGDQFARMFPDEPRRRQERKSLYIENSMLYITKLNALEKTRSVMGSKVRGFLIDEIEGLDINEWNDLYLAEFYVKNII